MFWPLAVIFGIVLLGIAALIVVFIYYTASIVSLASHPFAKDAKWWGSVGESIASHPFSQRAREGGAASVEMDTDDLD